MYMLISVFEREIITKQFNTLEEAHERMMSELKEEFDKYDFSDYGITWDKIEKKDSFGINYFGFGVGFAWSNIDYECRCDWKIVEIN